MEQPGSTPAPKELVSRSAVTAATLVFSAPTPGSGSRYGDGRVAHEARVLSAFAAGEAFARADERGVGETVLAASRAAVDLAGHADARAFAYLAPLSRASLLGGPLRRVLGRLDHADIEHFARALELAGQDAPLAGALRYALGAGPEATLRDAMRFSAGRDALAREYARGFEVTRELARPALLSALSRADSVRGVVVQAYLEVLSEVPDLDVAARAGRGEAEEVARMARGVLKAGGVHSRRGLEGIANLNGLLRADGRLAPTATEPPVIAGAFLVALEYGPDALAHRVRPARVP
jgi:triphosphoribosyl-dephospho-CoA synthase